VVNLEAIDCVCLDTDVLIDYLRKPSGEMKRIMELVFEKTLNARITTVNSFELWLGAFLSSKETLPACTDDFLSRFEIVDFDYGSSVEVGRVSADLKKRGDPIEIRDLFVGCICKVNNMPLVTRNLKHYKRINGLKIFSPEQALRTLNV
jgi:tRNA(fMet)-specific endonuclease VapC